MTATTVQPAPAIAEPAAPARHRPWVLVLLAGTAVLYLWNLTASGFGNTYYAAATQAASQSWQAWLFGSLDAGNAITVDKPPVGLWLSGLFARIFGFSSWTVLAPQALAGVAAVGLLHAAVRRTSGPVAGLLAGTALALTPVAALMFRYNNMDAVLTLLLVAGGYATVRALEQGRLRWLLLAGTCVGFAFLTKMMQAFLVLPAFGLVYLLAAPVALGRRLAHLAAALGAVVVSAGWYIALVALWPADSRPYISGSDTDSLLELALGYNGLFRIFGGGGPGGGGSGSGGVVVGGGGAGNIGFGGETSIGRMFGAAFGTEVSWLLPAALIGLGAGLWFTRRAPRTDRTRAALVLWGTWLVVTALVFSLMSGITHPYYAVALAPAVAVVVAITGRSLWRGRSYPAARAVLVAMVAVTGVWTFILLDRTPGWLPWLRWTIVVLTVLVAAAIAVGVPRMAVLAAVVGLAGTGAFTVATAATAHGGSIPASGPVSAGEDMLLPKPNAELTELLAATRTTWAAATNGSALGAELALASGRPVISIGGFSGGDPSPTLAEFQLYVASGQIAYYVENGGGDPRGESEIGQWVAENFTATTFGEQQVYNLTVPPSGG